MIGARGRETSGGKMGKLFCRLRKTHAHAKANTLHQFANKLVSTWRNSCQHFNQAKHSARVLIFPSTIFPLFRPAAQPPYRRHPEHLCELFESAQKFYAHGIKSKSKLLLIWRKINRQSRRWAVSSLSPSIWPSRTFVLFFLRAIKARNHWSPEEASSLRVLSQIKFAFQIPFLLTSGSFLGGGVELCKSKHLV